MSQEPPCRPSQHDQPVKYGDVFDVSGELASQPVAPRDAAAMQAAESMALGKTQKGGPAAVMQSAADANERAGFIRHTTATLIGRDEGVTVVETAADGNRIITEAIGDQVLAQYATPDVPLRASGAVLDQDSITIGEALEAAAVSVGDKPVDRSDAAAITSAEVRAAGTIYEIKPGGIGSTAQSAATHNERTLFFGDKTTIADVLADATAKLSDDKPVTREDAEGIIGAEIRNKPDMRSTPGGVAASMAAAARINQNK